MRCVLAMLTLLSFAVAPTLAQTSKAFVHEPLLDGITLTATGQATNFDRFVLILTLNRDSTAGTPSSDESAALRTLRDALTRYDLTETNVLPTGGPYPLPARGWLAFGLPKPFDGKSLGSGSVGDVMRAVVKAGGEPTATLISSYSPARFAQARRDALADALKNGRSEAEALASVASQKLGKMLAIRIEPNFGFNPMVYQSITAGGLESMPPNFNRLTLTLRFAME